MPAAREGAMVALLDPKNDYVFKRLFAGDPELTVALINDLRPDLQPVASVEILNPLISASELSGKGIVLDVRARCVDGHQYNIEMQVQRQLDWGSRSLFYLARLLSQQLSAGDEYQAVASAIGIHLLDFDLFTVSTAERGQALWRFEMRDAALPDVTLGSELQLTVMELKKADRLGQLQGPASDWVRFFEHWQEDTIMSGITHEPVKKAIGSIRQLSADEEAQRLAEAREWGRINWNLSIAAAHREGLEQGRIDTLRNALAQLLEQRFGPLSEWANTQLATAKVDQLDTWTKRILSAGSLEELLGRSG
ncbi:Rpn family recombination-promoting nuclease/putative transposase [Haliea sp.]|uniref:Rpn family recombination-promoting nuclease/putative transposase n=1 Tax=Haliea sp. TaxID=1932666 RepID=UPI003526E524